jgi:ABC-type Fe3+/spermidine/putrescine transport system ATPase subunit
MIEVTLQTGERLKASAGAERLAAGANVSVVARPEAIRIALAPAKAEANSFQGTIDRIVYTGAISTTIVGLPSGLKLTVEDQNDDLARKPLEPRQAVTVTLPPAALLIVPE